MAKGTKTRVPQETIDEACDAVQSALNTIKPEALKQVLGTTGTRDHKTINFGRKISGLKVNFRCDVLESGHSLSFILYSEYPPDPDAVVGQWLLHQLAGSDWESDCQNALKKERPKNDRRHEGFVFRHDFDKLDFSNKELWQKSVCDWVLAFAKKLNTIPKTTPADIKTFNNQEKNQRNVQEYVQKLRVEKLVDDGSPSAEGDPKCPEPPKGQDGKFLPRNLIWFGAPGTGKSHQLKEAVEGKLGDGGKVIQDTKNNIGVFVGVDNGKIVKRLYERVTFYPTYSYAQFVGCYKPVMKTIVADVENLLSSADLAQKLNQSYMESSESGKMTAVLSFVDQYIDSLKALDENERDELFKKSKLPAQTYKAWFAASIRAASQRAKQLVKKNGEEIAYKFVPGPFLRVLVDALKDPAHNHCLVIEEINRANAAAVFGDVFQLLDRGGKWNDGDDESIKPFFGDGAASEYDVAASEDIKRYLKEELANCKEAPKFLKVVPGKDENGNDIWKDCRLRIPSNMYIWATMNSADQGVFPMDTAFKRRWEFKYIGIDEGVTDELKEWTIAGVSDVNGQAYTYKWNDVRKFINGQLSLHGVNEDKLMGPWFVKPEKGISVSADQFKSKVLMYLWEDAARMCRTKLFKKEIKTYSELTKKWPDVFADSEAWNKVKGNGQADAGFNLPEGQSESDAGGTGAPAPSGS